MRYRLRAMTLAGALVVGGLTAAPRPAPAGDVYARLMQQQEEQRRLRLQKEHQARQRRIEAHPAGFGPVPGRAWDQVRSGGQADRVTIAPPSVPTWARRVMPIATATPGRPRMASATPGRSASGTIVAQRSPSPTGSRACL